MHDLCNSLCWAFNNLRQTALNNWDVVCFNEVKNLYFAMWHLSRSVLSLNLDTESNWLRMEPDAPSNHPQTLAHFESIGSTEVELPHTQQTQLCKQLCKHCLDVLWCFTPENSRLQKCNFRTHNAFPCQSLCSHVSILGTVTVLMDLSLVPVAFTPKKHNHYKTSDRIIRFFKISFSVPERSSWRNQMLSINGSGSS